MPPVEPPDSHRLSAAIGWCELGDVGEAALELERLDPRWTNDPDVLEVWWRIQATKQDWVAAHHTARMLVERSPDRSWAWLHRAYALRRCPDGGLEAAREALLPAFEKFPEEPVIPFNLACYACQLNRPDEARSWLDLAMKAGGKARIRRMALSDPDLEPLWPEIQER